MTRYSRSAIGVIGLGLLAAAGTAHAVQTIVTLDVIACDPNDPNDANAYARLLRPTGGQVIGYAITAIVAPDDDTYYGDPNITNGLGAAYVTLNTHFGDVTDIGGTQDLLGDSNLPVPFTNGVYHVWTANRQEA